MANTGSSRDMLLPWTSHKLNNFGIWRLEDRNRHVVAELAFNLDEDDIFGEKHITQFIRDACNESPELAQKEARIRELEDILKSVQGVIINNDNVRVQANHIGSDLAVQLLFERIEEALSETEKQDEQK